jgi:hypothetical protein
LKLVCRMSYVVCRMSYVDFDSETTDAAVRFGDGHWPDLNTV